LAVSRRESIRITSAALATFGVAVRGATVVPVFSTSSLASHTLGRDVFVRAVGDAG